MQLDSLFTQLCNLWPRGWMNESRIRGILLGRILQQRVKKNDSPALTESKQSFLSPSTTTHALAAVSAMAHPPSHDATTHSQSSTPTLSQLQSQGTTTHSQPPTSSSSSPAHSQLQSQERSSSQSQSQSQLSTPSPQSSTPAPTLPSAQPPPQLHAQLANQPLENASTQSPPQPLKQLQTQAVDWSLPSLQSLPLPLPSSLSSSSSFSNNNPCLASLPHQSTQVRRSLSGVSSQSLLNLSLDQVRQLLAGYQQLKQLSSTTRSAPSSLQHVLNLKAQPSCQLSPTVQTLQSSTVSSSPSHSRQSQPPPTNSLHSPQSLQSTSSSTSRLSESSHVVDLNAPPEGESGTQAAASNTLTNSSLQKNIIVIP
jgi:hypothetical protein